MTLVHDVMEMRAAQMMTEVQEVRDESAFPLLVKVGRSTFTLRDRDEARKFSLGMLAALEAREIEEGE